MTPKQPCRICQTKSRTDGDLCRGCARDTGRYRIWKQAVPREPDPPRGPLYEVFVEGQWWDVMWDGRV